MARGEPFDDEERSVDASIATIAERRLSQIIAALDLDEEYFERAHRAAANALDGADDRIHSDQLRRAMEALSAIPDPLMRARIRDLVVALARHKPA